MTYSALFSIGYFIFKEWLPAFTYLLIGTIALFGLRALMNKTKIFQ
jgi:hypothetical protein